jgi:hypothetical protein
LASVLPICNENPKYNFSFLGMDNKETQGFNEELKCPAGLGQFSPPDSKLSRTVTLYANNINTADNPSPYQPFISTMASTTLSPFFKPRIPTIHITPSDGSSLQPRLHFRYIDSMAG